MPVITFSRFFPAKHPRKGEPTFFVEKIMVSLFSRDDKSFNHEEMLAKVNSDLWEHDRDKIFYFYFRLDWRKEWEPKSHTIRAGNRWKVGDKFSPRVWSGKPYASKQIQFAPDIEIKKIWEYETDINGVPSINGLYLPEKINDMDAWEYLAMNDGLSLDDFICWFRIHPKKNKEDWSFKGQILCWNENINYE